MFRLPKTRPDKSGNRVDFRFSQFKVVQVPKGWQRLFLSMVSVESGKTIAKTGKGLVRNGVCQWSETQTESIWVSTDVTSEKMGDCFFKFVVGAGSARSGILGEATVNMTVYMSSSVAVPVSLALRKGNPGTTTLQFKIQCLNPRTKHRDDKSSGATNSTRSPSKVGSEELDVILNGSESTDSTTHQGEHKIREASFSASASNESFDSAGSSLKRQNYSSSENGLIRLDEPSESDNSTCDPLTGSENKSDQVKQLSASSSSITDSSKDLQEAAEETIQEFSAEAKMWKRNAQKLALDFSEQSKCMENLDMELSAANEERDVLRKEVERLQLLLENSTPKNHLLQEDSRGAQKEMENEIKLDKESISNLALQLQKSQDANVELVSVLRELEETIEKQKLEIEKHSTSDSQLQESGKNLQCKVQLLEQKLNDVGEQYRRSLSDKESEIVALKEKLCELERDCDELTDENLDLLMKLKDMKNNFARGTSDFASVEHECSTSTISEESEHDLVKRKVQGDDHYVQKLDILKMQMEDEIKEMRDEIERLEANLLLKEEENREIRVCCRELEVKVSDLEREKSQIEDEMEGVLRESGIATKCLDDMQNDLMALSNGMDSHVSANKILQRKASELESEKRELETRLSELQNEKEEFLLNVSGLEAQIRDLQKLRMKNVELNEKCATLKTKLMLSDTNLNDYSRKVEALEEKLSLVMRDFASNGKELEALLDKNRELEEKLRMEESSWNQLFLKKTDEVETLQQEIENLTRQMDEVCCEKGNLQEESERKLQGLIEELSASREKQEMLRASEEKLKTILNDVELKLSESECEQKQLTEANKMYKVRLNRLSSDSRNIQSPQKPRNEGNFVTRERYERTKSSLEAELKDIRQRYLEMSLKYAEVECQREELVMKLKGKKNIKRWLSNPSN